MLTGARQLPWGCKPWGRKGRGGRNEMEEGKHKIRGWLWGGGGGAAHAGCRNATPVTQRALGQACASMSWRQNRPPPAHRSRHRGELGELGWLSPPPAAAPGHGTAQPRWEPVPCHAVSPFCSLLCSPPAWQHLPHAHGDSLRGSCCAPKVPSTLPGWRRKGKAHSPIFWVGLEVFSLV